MRIISGNMQQNTNEILSVPDESGWFFFKKNKRSEPVIVFVNEDGIGITMDSSGKQGELDDMVGMWLELDSDF